MEAGFGLVLIFFVVVVVLMVFSWIYNLVTTGSPRTPIRPGDCPACRGRGTVLAPPSSSGNWDRMKCSRCRGTGRVG
ncbi:hypothetical protein [Thermoactinospora rubra]|uniref:hypothetical protein n=1 Tax=Thermoactinospora rubra TaxID=1088767 RepID=UPI000A110FDE|nr:hypothetical protein [Thermoactinospora rubra]